MTKKDFKAWILVTPHHSKTSHTLKLHHTTKSGSNLKARVGEDIHHTLEHIERGIKDSGNNKLSWKIRMGDKIHSGKGHYDSKNKEIHMYPHDAHKNMHARFKKTEEINIKKSDIACQDCGGSLYTSGKEIKLCLCYGEFMGKSIKIEEDKNGKIKLNFPKDFNIDNLEMLLDCLKKENK